MTEGGPFDAGFPAASPQPRSVLGRRRLEQQLRHLNDALPLALAGALGLGILAFFALPFEPSLRPTVAFCVLGVLVALSLFRRSRIARWLSLLPALACIGFTSAVWQSHRLGDHLLDEPVFDVALIGTVQNVLWRADGPRFIIGDIQGQPESGLSTLQTVQIKWRGLDDDAGLGRSLLGQKVEWRVTLLPVRGSIVPGGFDFRRQAFFKGLSAYGYSLGPPDSLSTAKPAFTENWRQTMRERFINGLRGDAAGLATALVVGLRGDLSERAEAQIRAAGLAHILAISGLHIGMVTGALFFLVRLLGAWVPVVSLRLPMHRVARLYGTSGGGGVFLDFRWFRPDTARDHCCGPRHDRHFALTPAFLPALCRPRCPTGHGDPAFRLGNCVLPNELCGCSRLDCGVQLQRQAIKAKSTGTKPGFELLARGVDQQSGRNRCDRDICSVSLSATVAARDRGQSDRCSTHCAVDHAAVDGRNAADAARAGGTRVMAGTAWSGWSVAAFRLCSAV